MLRLTYLGKNLKNKSIWAHVGGTRISKAIILPTSTHSLFYFIFQLIFIQLSFLLFLLLWCFFGREKHEYPVNQEIKNDFNRLLYFYSISKISSEFVSSLIYFSITTPIAMTFWFSFYRLVKIIIKFKMAK